MINPDVIQSVIESAKIEDVVGEYVNLKKRGVNLLGLCPFHNEKTPSFTVSPAKNIFKCFGCGKAGNSVNFLMEHEHFSYIEAIKHLAKKYGIEIEEEEFTPEQVLLLNEKEKLFNLNLFAQTHFIDNINNTEEGKAIGLSYFIERGFREDIIAKFCLGYSVEARNGFASHAVSNGYPKDVLVASGLIIERDEDLFDRFRARVIFPIHNLSGRVVGFGGRILSSDKNLAKYINSPENEIYHKSKVLYGMYFAKSSIVKNDNCYLVEGYTDVISMHQAGVENVVASSGTSLTTEQIKLIKRYTENITILYDGDAAGIKASFRGIDMILEEGMNVKIVLFPDGEDPDSFARKNRPAEVKEFITNNAFNFLTFKTNLLLEEAENDPIKKASLIKEIVNSIALIPDQIKRSVFIKECSNQLKVSEAILFNELNKIRRTSYQKKIDSEKQNPDNVDQASYPSDKQIEEDTESAEFQEKAIIYLLLKYGNEQITVKAIDEDNEEIDVNISAARYIVADILADKELFGLKDPVYSSIFETFADAIDKEYTVDENFFYNHENEIIRKTSIDIMHTNYEISALWKEQFKIVVKKEEDDLRATIDGIINSLKAKKVELLLTDNKEKIKSTTDPDELDMLMHTHKKLLDARKEINTLKGRIIIK